MIPINIMTQPDDFTCGPTSLHAVYSYYNDPIGLDDVIGGISYLEDGGTLAVHLGSHALQRGYRAKIYTYDLDLFDPTWYSHDRATLIEKLTTQKQYKHSKKLHHASDAYIKFLNQGGELKFENLVSSILHRYFQKKIPVLAGLSSTYLYQCPREHVTSKKKTRYDDLRGYATGHFVVLCGYNKDKQHIVVADPYAENPQWSNNYYSVPTARLINAILLGIMTYDANLLIIQPRKQSSK